MSRTHVNSYPGLTLIYKKVIIKKSPVGIPTGDFYYKNIFIFIFFRRLLLALPDEGQIGAAQTAGAVEALAFVAVPGVAVVLVFVGVRASALEQPVSAAEQPAFAEAVDYLHEAAQYYWQGAPGYRLPFFALAAELAL